MSAVALAVGGAVAGIGGALISSSAAGDAANAQVQAANTASQTELSMYNQTQANEQPYMQAGNNSLQALMQGLGLTSGSNGAVANGALSQPFSQQQFQQSPATAYLMQQGNQSIQNSAAAHGGLVSGNALMALQANGMGLAQQDYTTQQAAYQAQQQQQFNMLQTLAGSGQNAAAKLGSLGSSTASQIGSNTIQAGNASAAGTVASAVASANSLSNLLNSNSFQSGVSSLFGGSSGLGAYTPSASTLSGGAAVPTYADPAAAGLF